ncbi:MAG: hypothetical protein AB3N28_04500 [Kordiimonas sp.]
MTKFLSIGTFGLVILCFTSGNTEASGDRSAGVPEYSPNSCVALIAERKVKEPYCHRVIELADKLTHAHPRNIKAQISLIEQINSVLLSKNDLESTYHFGLQAAEGLLFASNLEGAAEVLRRLPQWPLSTSIYSYYLKIYLGSMNARLGLPLRVFSSVEDLKSAITEALRKAKEPVFANRLAFSAINLGYYFIQVEQYNKAISLMDICQDANVFQGGSNLVSMCYSSFLDLDTIPYSYRRQIARKLYDLTCNGSSPGLCRLLGHKFEKYGLGGAVQ